jgi:hypothetical protein
VIAEPNGGPTWTESPYTAIVTVDPSASGAHTWFDDDAYTWHTVVPANSHDGNIFLGGFGFLVPDGGLAANPQVTWSGDIDVDGTCVGFHWRVEATVFTTFPDTQEHPSEFNHLGVKPIDGPGANPYNNLDHAGTMENSNQDQVPGAQGGFPPTPNQNVGPGGC